MKHCKNCDAPFTANFCSECGQKDVDLERPLSQLLAEVVREIFDVDGRAIRTLWTLIRHPGVLTSEFLAGRRKLYSSPLRLYLVISVLFFVLTAWAAGRGVLLREGKTLEADAARRGRRQARAGDDHPGTISHLPGREFRCFTEPRLPSELARRRQQGTRHYLGVCRTGRGFVRGREHSYNAGIGKSAVSY
jgi:hypothetical protein